MNIQDNYNCNNNYNVSMRGANFKKIGSGIKHVKNKVEQGILDAFKEKTIDDGKKQNKKISWINNIIARPDTNRLIMGVTALATQPWIDLSNRRVDEETRKVSMRRTIAKIIAGCSVGILVRGGCYTLVSKMTNIESSKKFERLLLPEKNSKIYNLMKKSKHVLNGHRNAFSTIIALLVMCYTNFKIDAPLTSYLTNKFNDKAEKKKMKNIGKEIANV